MRHIPALDGIRGIAIILVLLFHLHIPGLSLGWAGVPLFFVLSGFLITGILIDAKKEKFSYYIKSFYIKRTLRIFPLFYLYLILNFLALVVTNRPVDGYAWYFSYLQNYHLGAEIYSQGYIPGIVAHTWSLAVEEQFYLLWPFVVFFLNRKQLAYLCIVLIVAAPVTRWIILQDSGNIYMANVTLPGCLDMMAYGALLAILRTSTIKIVSALVFSLFSVGALLMLYAIYTLGLDAFWNPEKWTAPAFYAYTALAFIFGLPIWLVTKTPVSLLVCALTTRPLLYTGKISYGLYIWHYAVFLIMDKITLKLNISNEYFIPQIISLIASYAIAAASYYIFEVHFLRIKDRLYVKPESKIPPLSKEISTSH